MCAECGQMFTRLGHLRRHTRLHTGDKPFMCNRCACQFARADHLRRHLQAHHADDPALRTKDPNSAPDFLTNIKPELDGVPTSGDNLSVFGALAGSIPSESAPAVNQPVFPGPGTPDTGSHKSHQGDVDPAPVSGDNLSEFSMLPGGGRRPDVRSTDSVPVFPGRGAENLTSDASQSNYRDVDILPELQNARVEGGDRGHTTAAGSSVPYETQTGAALPIFSGHREEKSATHYAAVEIPAELKDPQLDGRKSTGMENCDEVGAVPRFPESSNRRATLSPPEHRNFPVSGDSAAFRADFWHRTSPTYVNDRLFLAGAANLRHFDVNFSRQSEASPTNLARRYSQPHSMMPGNFFGSVVDFRRFPPENPAVTSQQSDTAIPEASPLSLARYQQK